MFGTNNTPAFHAIHTRYCWTRIHTFDVNCLKASTEKVKQPKLLFFFRFFCLSRIRDSGPVRVKQDHFRSICFYFLPFTVPSFFGYAQNVARSCSCGDQVVTHTHKKTTITLHLRARVNNIIIITKIYTKQFIQDYTKTYYAMDHNSSSPIYHRLHFLLHHLLYHLHQHNYYCEFSYLHLFLQITCLSSAVLSHAQYFLFHLCHKY